MTALHHCIVKKPDPMLMLSVGMVAAIFVLDLFTPLGWADGFLYLIPLTLMFRSPQSHRLVGFAALCSGLIILGWIFSPPGGAVEPVTYNRTMGIAILWMTALFLRQRKQVEKALCLSQEVLERRVEEQTDEFRRAIQKLKQEITDRKQADEALRKSEARNRAILESALDGIITINHEGQIVEFNPAAEAMFGYVQNEVLGKEMVGLIIPPSFREKHLNGFAQHLATGRTSIIGRRQELTAMRANGDEFPVELAVTRIGLNGPPSFTAFIRDITERKRAEETLRESEQRLSRLLEDRERISRDLHDNIIQMLYAIGLGFEECQRLFGEKSKTAGGIIRRIIGDLNGVIRDVRSYVTWTEPKISSGRQLTAAIERLARTMEGAHLLHFRLKVSPAATERLLAEEAEHLLHIVREAMSNSLRHSMARNGLVSLQACDGYVRLQVEDDGIGFDSSATQERGEGLRNIAARVEKLGGTLEIVSERGQGVRVVIDLPRESEHASA